MLYFVYYRITSDSYYFRVHLYFNIDLAVKNSDTGTSVSISRVFYGTDLLLNLG